MFTREVFQGGGVAHLLPAVVEGPFTISGVEVEPLPVRHGAVTTFGYRVGDLAYVPDAKEIPGETRERLRGLDLLILDALSYNPKHPTHLSVGQALEIVEAVQPRRVLLTHMMHRVDHHHFRDQCAEHECEVPAHVGLSCDGQVLEL
jgi:phosphoribosyl 1,2-cyclic phosphate phosphodiesterase